MFLKTQIYGDYTIFSPYFFFHINYRQNMENIELSSVYHTQYDKWTDSGEVKLAEKFWSQYSQISLSNIQT
jgi:hypothetical protein